MHNLDGNFPAVNRRRDDTERVLMYAEGPFLRGFACVAFDMLNEFGLWRGGVTLVQAGHEVNEAHDREIELLKKQDGLYTVIAAGAENGVKKTDKRLITCVTDCINLYKDYNNYLGRARNPELRVIVSCTNAEEFVYCENEKAYTRPQASFPAKFTAFLYERFKFFGGDLTKGLIILPCEAVENNGENLRKIMQKYANLWELSLEFMQWVNRSCVFTNTVTDRIVAGYPHDEADRICGDLGYRDELLCSTELFYFWAIESANYAGQLREELPFEQLKKAGLDIVISDDIKAHQLKKMRLFSGGTIAMAHAALLGGCTTASHAASDETFGRFTENLLFREIIPTIDINRNLLEGYARSLSGRLANPFIKYDLQEITRGGIYKFKTYLLPTMLEYRRRFGKFPPLFTVAFAAMLAFYKSGGRFQPVEQPTGLVFLRENDLKVIFKNVGFWEVDFAEDERFCAEVEEVFRRVRLGDVRGVVGRGTI